MQTYRREDRIRKKADFDRLFRRGARKAGPLLTVLAARSPFSRARLGVCVGRKCRGAPRRNRLKRLVREAFRRRKAELPPFDLVVVAKQSESTLAEIERELVSLARELGDQE